MHIVAESPSLEKISNTLHALTLQVVAEGAGRWLVTIVIVIEHVLVLVALLLWFGIPNEPEQVRIAVARRAYLDNRDSERARHAARLSAVKSGH